ncbi:MAG TPA: PhnD/SsuA/transferrin family substrate-binding protein [Phycisphaerae bacterium]|nr:PhnD/SsuA/transferrin family substrate-binding protein [Phycisphaerae bacterium]
MTMRMQKSSPILIIVGMLAASLATGCSEQTFSSSVLNPFDFKMPFVPQKEPVRIGIVSEGVGLFDPSTWKIGEVGSPWTPLRLRLERYLNSPVQISPLKPFQVAAHLQSGRVDFAFLSAREYVDLSKEFGDLGTVIAVSDVLERQGLIVADAKSDIQSLKDIAGKRFSFGPAGDPVLDTKARETLVANGVEIDSIQKEILPIPNTFQHHISSAESAYEIAYGLGTSVGVIEKSEYLDYPESDGSFLLRTFGKDNFRVLAQTEPVRVDTIPEGPFLAASDTDEELIQRVQKFLLSASENDQSALSAMGLAGFVTPVGDVNSQLTHLAAAQPASKSAGGADIMKPEK